MGKKKTRNQSQQVFSTQYLLVLTKIGVERNAKGNIKITILFTATEGGQCDSQKVNSKNLTCLFQQGAPHSGS